MRVKPLFWKYRARLPPMKPPAPVMTIKSSFCSLGSFSTSRLFISRFIQSCSIAVPHLISQIRSLILSLTGQYRNDDPCPKRDNYCDSGWNSGCDLTPSWQLRDLFGQIGLMLDRFSVRVAPINNVKADLSGRSRRRRRMKTRPKPMGCQPISHYPAKPGSVGQGPRNSR